MSRDTTCKDNHNHTRKCISARVTRNGTEAKQTPRKAEATTNKKNVQGKRPRLPNHFTQRVKQRAHNKEQIPSQTALRKIVVRGSRANKCPRTESRSVSSAAAKIGCTTALRRISFAKSIIVSETPIYKGFHDPTDYCSRYQNSCS